PYDTGIDLRALDEVTRYFTPIREKYLQSGLLDPKVMKVDVNGLLYQVPGGMLSNLVSQLKQMGRSDALADVLAEVPRVRADAGYPPLVTPSSQIVGTQAVMNVIGGERYKMVTKEFRALMRGEYGKTPMAPDPEFVKKIIGDAEAITCRPADLLEPELDRLRAAIAPYLEQEEDVLSYVLFEQVALKFFERRKNERFGLDGKNGDPQSGVHVC
ncbi:MAG: oxaloacetate decarboxylase subunit alpha, partial [Clostridia bacterium]|nr:oxaloacetate decarboxylase subunit alpha [Clostridia bacterium]